MSSAENLTQSAKRKHLYWKDNECKHLSTSDSHASLFVLFSIQYVFVLSFEPEHSIFYRIVYAPNEDSLAQLDLSSQDIMWIVDSQGPKACSGGQRRFWSSCAELGPRWVRLQSCIRCLGRAVRDFDLFWVSPYCIFHNSDFDQYWFFSKRYFIFLQFYQDIFL